MRVKSKKDSNVSEIISVCTGMSCSFEFSEKIIFDLQRKINDLNLQKVEIIENGCTGLCNESPVIRLLNGKKCFTRIKCNQLDKIVDELLKK